MKKILFFVFICLSTHSFANCTGTVISNTTDTEFDGTKKKCETVKDIKGKDVRMCPSEQKSGAKLTGISQYRENSKTGAPVLCVHGGGCYPSKDIKTSEPCMLGFFKE